MIAALGVVMFMALFFLECKVYDLATGMFFAFGLGLISRGKWQEYFALFAFASVNRETSFLMAMVFGVWGIVNRDRAWLMAMGYQGFLFVAIRICLMVIFAENPGVTMMVRPVENLQAFIASPLWALVHWAVIGYVAWMALRYSGSRFMRAAFWVMMPALMVMYLVLGVSYEVRVFAEVFPVVWMMMVDGNWKGVESSYEKM